MPPLRPASETVIAFRCGVAPSVPSRRGVPVPFPFPPSSMCSPSAGSSGLGLFTALVLARALAALGRALLPLLDELADLVSALAADLLVEGRPALRLDRLAALLPDLLVEAGAPLRLDRVAALLPDLLVELPAALGLDRLAPLLADLLVELPAARLANADPALAARLRDRHRALAAALLLLSHGSPPRAPVWASFSPPAAAPEPTRARRSAPPCPRPWPPGSRSSS